MSAFADITFRCMGSDIRILAGPGPVDSALAVQDARLWLEEAAQRLSRFEAGSELCALNAGLDERVPASALLRVAVTAGLRAARATGGLIDLTLLGELEAAGYARSRDAAAPAALADALAAAPGRAPARAHPAARWRTVLVDDGEQVITRPPGVRLDTGGIGKGLLADALAHRLRAHAWAAVDCGGDLRVAGGTFPVEVRHPLTGEIAHRLTLARGGIATSGLDVNVWRRPDGTYAHHLLDPSTGRPAWTGLVGATALGESALAAETLAKHALLSGPDGARRVLAACGGIAFHDDGEVELIGLSGGAGRRVVLAASGARR
jgi:thiamine biosynthesis lipoprotein